MVSTAGQQKGQRGRIIFNHALASCSGISSGQHSWTTERTVRSAEHEPRACVLLQHLQWSAQPNNRKDSDLNHTLASCSGISSGQHRRTTERTVRCDDLEPHACVLLRHFQWSAQLDNRKDSDLNHTLASWSGFSSGQHRRTTEKSVRCDDLEPHVCILLWHLQWTTVRTMGSDGPCVLFRYLQWSAQRNSRKDSEER